MKLLSILRPGVVLLAATAAPLLRPIDPGCKAAEGAVPSEPGYQQRLFSPTNTLVPPADAGNIVSRFRTAYPKLGSPRFLIYVNRELVDTRSGFKLAGREETVVSNRREASRDVSPAPADDADSNASSPTGQVASGRPGSEAAGAGPGPGASATGLKGVGVDGAESPAQTARAVVSSLDKKLATVNRYERADREEDSFEYRQLVRDLEQVFGRRLRSAGASLADQRIATALIADRPLRDFVTPTEGEQARKDREALARVADVVIEILIANRDVTVYRVSGPITRSKPEIQATAIRLSDARVLGQANSANVTGPVPHQPSLVNRFGSRDIADATALALMDDMLLGLQP